MSKEPNQQQYFLCILNIFLQEILEYDFYL